MDSRSNAEPTGRILKFGDCHLDKIERRVYKKGKPIELSPRSFDVLQLLAERSGEILPKETFLDHVWADSFVEEGNLAVHISRLRKALKATKTEPYIETVSGTGYRFVSRVYLIDEDVWEHQLIKDPVLSAAAAERELRFDSIAVLPLLNENGDEEVEYLADGLTESIINDLSSFPGLRVLARNTVFRFKGQVIDVQEVGKKLEVSSILTGRLRLVRDKLVISVELSDTSNGTQFWGTHFNELFDDVLDIQERITGAILDSLSTRLGSLAKRSQAARMTENTESYRSYLKGRYLLNKRSIKDVNKAMQYFQHSISLDPTNAHSYIQLADCCLLLQSYEQKSQVETITQASALLDRFVESHPPIPELLVSRGYLKMFLHFDVKGAEKDYQMAISMNPCHVEAYWRYSQLLIYTNRYADALVQMKAWIKVDPVSPVTNKNLSRMFYCMGQYQSAIMVLEESLELEPDDFETHLLLGTNFAEINEFDRALTAFQRSLDLQYHVETISMIGYTQAISGNVQAAQETILFLEESSKKQYVSPSNMGIIYSALGCQEQALKCLEKSLEDRYSDLIALRCDPRWKGIKSLDRFIEIINEIGVSD